MERKSREHGPAIAPMLSVTTPPGFSLDPCQLEELLAGANCEEVRRQRMQDARPSRIDGGRSAPRNGAGDGARERPQARGRGGGRFKAGG
jgi:hypothetical protein